VSAAPTDIAALACRVLQTANPVDKVELTADAAEAWRAGGVAIHGTARPPRRPARPRRPRLLPPSEMPRRGVAPGGHGHVALLHALAHIELNAIDLAWDLLARFGEEVTEAAAARAFVGDWVRVAEEEAQHFTMLTRHLDELGMAYGDLPAHDGLWEAAEDTSHDLLARLAVVPLVLEARGLDVTPGMRKRLARAGDERGAAILDRIHADEIGHVAVGRHWFEHVCSLRGLAPVTTYHDLVRRHFRSALKAPFNRAARTKAGLGEEFYLPLAAMDADARPAQSG
jgi:uncharacterized ferritin-like protein (DUF455 family)